MTSKVYFQYNRGAFCACTIAKRLPKLPSAKYCPTVRPADVPAALGAAIDSLGFRRLYIRRHPDGRLFGDAEFTPDSEYVRSGGVMSLSLDDGEPSPSGE